jgi:hypothetical protein
MIVNIYEGSRTWGFFGRMGTFLLLTGYCVDAIVQFGEDTRDQLGCAVGTAVNAGS